MSGKMKKKYIKSKNADALVKSLIDKEMSFSLRETSDCTEVIVDEKHFVYSNQKSFPRNKVYLFNVVNIQVNKWLKENDVYLINIAPSINYNYDYDTDLGVMCGTDLNHAYWRIAYLYGMITEKTYISGLDTESKALRLATLSVLGREKVFHSYKNGKKTEQYVSQKENIELKNVFKYIRVTCFTIMQELSELLGDDFFAWKTDCIYYRQTDENVKMVHDFFDSYDLTYKQLGY